MGSMEHLFPMLHVDYLWLNILVSTKFLRCGIELHAIQLLTLFCATGASFFQNPVSTSEVSMSLEAIP